MLRLGKNVFHHKGEKDLTFVEHIFGYINVLSYAMTIFKVVEYGLRRLVEKSHKPNNSLTAFVFHHLPCFAYSKKLHFGSNDIVIFTKQDTHITYEDSEK